MSPRQPIEKSQLDHLYHPEHLMSLSTPPVANVIDALFLEPDSVVVELGAGTGHYTLPIAQRLEDGNNKGLIFAFEYSREMIKRLDSRAVGLGVDFRIRTWPLGNLRKPYMLPVQDEVVDRILAVNFFQYIDDCRAFLIEIARILKPGGVGLIANWSRREDLVEEFYQELYVSSGTVLENLSEAGFPTYTLLSLEGYTWAVRIAKPRNLES